MKAPAHLLVKQAQSGDRNAFGQLILQYQEKLLYLGYDLLGNWEDAQDAAQETFIKAFEKLPAFEGRAHFSTWLYRIMVNQCRDVHRKRARAPVDLYEGEDLESAAQNAIAGYSGNDDVIKQMENSDLRDQIEVGMQQLSLNQRTALSLRFFHEYSTADIAAVMECSENTVRIHIFRGLHRLKSILTKINTR